MLEPTFPRTSGKPPPGVARDFETDDAVESFWEHYARGAEPHRAAIATLARRALAVERDAAVAGTRLLFERVVEPLCDAFTAQGANAYRRTFAQIIGIARRRPECAPLAAELRTAGIRSEQDLLRPAAAAAPLDAADRERVRRVVLLSRLTLGADVAICAPALRRLHALFPRARIYYVGGVGARVLANGVARAAHAPVDYRRAGTLAERLNAWPALRAAVLGACAHGLPERYVVVDPDSRLTQLGLLAPTPARYYHFPSRSYGAEGDEPLGALVCRWLQETFGAAPAEEGALLLPDREAEWSRALRASLEPGPVAVVSFGVGGNARKRAGVELEVRLVEWLTRRNYRVLLARGVGADEIVEAYRLAARLEQRGVPVLHLPKGRNVVPAGAAAPVVTWEGDVAAFFAAIACADLYLGYDSAGQHIAAALGVPTVSVFLQSAGPRHAARWSPRGRGAVKVVRSVVPADPERLLERVCEAVIGSPAPEA